MTLNKLYTWRILIIDDHKDIGYTLEKIPFKTTFKQAYMIKNKILKGIRDKGDMTSRIRLERVKPVLQLETDNVETL